MDFNVFITTFGVIFLAELGDKTQLTAMALAVRFPWQKTFIGIAAAFAVLNVGAVAFGKLLFAFIPMFWIMMASAGLFLFFGIATLRGSGSEDEVGEEKNRFRGKGALATSFLMILMAELGDKTQLVTASLAAQHDAPVAVFTGSTLALWSVSLLGIFAGRQLTRFVPLTYIHRAAGFLFIIFGAAMLFKAFNSH
jgi:Ca2+/H+ antiporter, TMEM165/GDT1 family